MNILSTIHSKYQGETMFCFVCVATVFGYILGVNRVIDAIISKHSDETRVKVVKTLNKYSQTNLGDLAEILASNHLILSRTENNDYSNNDDQGDNQCDDQGDNNANGNDNNTNETSANLNSQDNTDSQVKTEDKEKQIQENTVMSPSSSSSVSTSEEDYELVRKNENVNHSKNKNNSKLFEWLTIF